MEACFASREVMRAISLTDLSSKPWPVEKGEVSAIVDTQMRSQRRFASPCFFVRLCPRRCLLYRCQTYLRSSHSASPDTTPYICSKQPQSPPWSKDSVHPHSGICRRKATLGPGASGTTAAVDGASGRQLRGRMANMMMRWVSRLAVKDLHSVVSVILV